MPQFGRPSTDTTLDNWQEDDGTTTAIFDQVDEVVADDADFIRTVLTPTNDVYVTRLTSVEDPQSSTGHIVRYRYGKDAAGGAQIDLTVQLRENYISEASQGTLIATIGTLTNIPVVWNAGSYTLVAAEADAIVNYASLYLRFVGNSV